MATDQEALLLQISADTSRLEKQFAKAIATVDSGAKTMEARANTMGERLSASLGKTEIGAALDKVFDASRFAVLEEGGAKLKVFGSALEPLGPLGLAAAAGLVAVGFAIEQALKTAEWAEGLERASKALGLTTTQLQEFDFVATATGIPVDKLRETLGGLEKTIGLVETHAARANTLKLFTEGLKITPEQLKGWGDLETQLPHILDALAKLDVEARNAFASRMKIDPEVINSLIESRDRLADLVKQAHEYGIVVDEDVVKRSADAADKMRVAADIIDRNLKVAFVGLATPIADASLALAKFVSLLQSKPDDSALIASIRRVIGDMGKLALLGPLFGGAAVVSGGHPQSNPVTPADMERFITGDKGGGSIPTISGGRGGHHARTSTFDIGKADIDAIAKAQEAELRARLALTNDAEARLAIENQLNATAIERQKADNLALVFDHKRGMLAALQVETALNRQQGEEDALRQRQATWAIEDKEEEVHKALLDAQIAELEAQVSMAATQTERDTIERKILELRHQEEWHLQGRDNSRAVQSGTESQDQADAKMAAGLSQRASETSILLYQQTYQPIHDALSAAVHGGWPGLVSYMASKLEESLIDVFAKNLTQQFLGGGSGSGGGLGGFFSTALSFLGFADGGDPPVGVPSIVGERGPELFVPRTAGTVVPNHMMNLVRGGVPSQVGGSAPIYLHVQVDAKDAVLSQTVATWIAHGIAAAAPGIQRAAKTDTLQTLAKAQAWRLA